MFIFIFIIIDVDEEESFKRDKFKALPPMTQVSLLLYMTRDSESSDCMALYKLILLTYFCYVP